MSNLAGKELAFLSPVAAREPRYYGGVQNDFEWMQLGVLSVTFNLHPGVNLMRVCFLADAGVSLVTDTLTLPIVAYQRHTDSFQPILDASFPTNTESLNTEAKIAQEIEQLLKAE